jgi:hypothetical protein
MQKQVVLHDGMGLNIGFILADFWAWVKRAKRKRLSTVCCG